MMYKKNAKKILLLEIRIGGTLMNFTLLFFAEKTRSHELFIFRNADHQTSIQDTTMDIFLFSLWIVYLCIYKLHRYSSIIQLYTNVHSIIILFVSSYFEYHNETVTHS
jgi:hypothetical protein